MKGYVIVNKRENNIKNLYNHSKGAWPQNNIWHEYSFNVISKFVEKELSITTNKEMTLNAGSGGTEYKIKSQVMHVDIAENLIKNKDKFVVASVEKLPFQNEFFDNTICVGSVLNYCNAMSAISELSRTLKRGGKLLLEFERAESGQFIFTHKYHRSIFPQKYKYNNQNHLLWMYSESYIKDLLSLYHLKIIKVKYFHVISSLACRNKKLEENNILSMLIKADRYCNLIAKFMAHNVIYCCIKI